MLIDKLLISVVIPTYKNRGGLQKSIDSVLSQDYNNYEVIVVDDNDPNSAERKNTEHLMNLYTNCLKVRYIKHEKNKNGAAARNTGIRAAKGEYIAFLDDDDAFYPTKLRKQLDYMQRNPNVDAVYCFAEKKGKIIKTVPYEGDVSKQLLLLESNMFTPTLIFKKAALLDIHGFDESFTRHQDYELLLKFFANGYKIGCVKECLVEIGSNQGENIPCGKKLENLKVQFLSRFDEYIKKYDETEAGFKKKVYAKHYAGVFLNHLRHHYVVKAVRIFFKYYFYSPIVFSRVLLYSARVHLNK